MTVRGEDSNSGRDSSSRLPANVFGENGDSRRVSVLASVIPDAVTTRLLACSLEAPARFSVGHSSQFRFHVKNRAPVSLVLTLPSSRPWGWRVDGEPEAGIGRFDPPKVPSKLALRPREQRTFTGSWNGQIRNRVNGRDIWTPVLGERELVAYIAVDGWDQRGLYARQTVEVV